VVFGAASEKTNARPPFRLHHLRLAGDHAVHERVDERYEAGSGRQDRPRRVEPAAEHDDVTGADQPRVAVDGRQHVARPLETEAPRDLRAGDQAEPGRGDRAGRPRGAPPPRHAARPEGTVRLADERGIRRRLDHRSTGARCVTHHDVAPFRHAAPGAQHLERRHDEWAGGGPRRHARRRRDAPYERPAVVGPQLVRLKNHLALPPPG
jgi:hypothetical protein